MVQNTYNTIHKCNYDIHVSDNTIFRTMIHSVSDQKKVHFGFEAKFWAKTMREYTPKHFSLGPKKNNHIFKVKIEKKIILHSLSVNLEKCVRVLPTFFEYFVCINS